MTHSRRVAVCALALAAVLCVNAARAQVAGDRLVLSASSAKTATSAGTTAQDWVPRDGAATFQLDVTAAATEAGDTLDVFVQTTLDGTNWVDVVHFTQVTGNGGAKRHFAKVAATEPQAMFENATALAAGSVRNVVGTTWRARWVVVDVATTSNQSFTFSVTAVGGSLSSGR